jgi:hypothetical protein
MKLFLTNISCDIKENINCFVFVSFFFASNTMVIRLIIMQQSKGFCADIAVVSRGKFENFHWIYILWMLNEAKVNLLEVLERYKIC